MEISKSLDSKVIKNQSVHSPIHPFESTAQVPKPSSISMCKLIEMARQAKERPTAEKAMEIERRVMDARRNLERMVAIVEFNDPFIDFTHVFMSRQQLLEAREAAVGAKARIVTMARGRELEELN
jgi:chromatin segregation and condensation protein Rec8/ScpA/Scc1 (kleisin family)